MREIGLFTDRLLKQFLQMDLMDLYPDQPDFSFDHPAWWGEVERREYMVFIDLVVEGKHQHDFGSYCEQLFLERNVFENELERRGFA